MKQSLLAILMATRKKPEIRQGYILDTTRRSELCQIYTCGVTDYAVRKHTICLHRNQSLDPLWGLPWLPMFTVSLLENVDYTFLVGHSLRNRKRLPVWIRSRIELS